MQSTKTQKAQIHTISTQQQIKKLKNQKPLTQLNLSTISYSQFLAHIAQILGNDQLCIKYIDGDGDEAVFQDQQDYSYIRNQMAKVPVIKFYVLVKKQTKQMSKILKVSYPVRDLVCQFVYNISCMPKEQEYCKILDDFIKFIGKNYGMKIYQLKYQDSDEETVSICLDATILGAQYDTNYKYFDAKSCYRVKNKIQMEAKNIYKNNLRGWKNFINDIQLLQNNKHQIQLKDATPNFNQNNIKSILLYVSENRKVWVEIQEKASYQEIQKLIFEEFGKKKTKMHLNINPEPLIPPTVSESSSWKWALKQAFNGSIFYIEDHHSDNIMELNVHIGKNVYKYEINKDSPDSLDQIIKNCIQKFVPKNKFSHLEYYDASDDQIAIMNAGHWATFLQEFINNKGKPNQIIVKTFKSGEASDIDSFSQFRSNLAKKQSNKLIQQNKFISEKKKQNYSIFSEAQKAKYAQRQKKRDEEHKKLLKEIQTSLTQNGPTTERNSRQIIYQRPQKHLPMISNHNGVQECQKCESSNFNEFYYRYCKNCKEFSRIEKIIKEQKRQRKESYPFSLIEDFTHKMMKPQ